MGLIYMTPYTARRDETVRKEASDTATGRANSPWLPSFIGVPSMLGAGNFTVLGARESCI